MKLCQHHSSFRTEKLADIIQHSKKKCSNTKKHTEDQDKLWLCLTCGNVGCSRSTELKCAQQHFLKEKHKLTVSLKDASIYCYECDEMFEQMIEMYEGYEPKSKSNDRKYESLRDFKQKVEQLISKSLVRQESKGYTMQIEKANTKYPKDYGYMETEEVKIQKKQTKTNKYNVFGLSNLGNTCFFNSIMQSLYASRFFHEAYLDLNFTKICGESSSMQEIEDKYEDLEEKYYAKNFKKTESQMSINQRFRKFLIDATNVNVFSPNDVFAAVGNAKSKFRSMAQQDAQQLLRYLLDALNQGEITHLAIDRYKLKCVENKYGKQQLTYIEKIFGCYLASRLHCQNCNLVSWTLDLCLDLSIEILREKYKEDMPIPHSKPIPESEIKFPGLQYPDKDTKVPALLYSFFSPEILTKQNYFSCEKCKASKAIKKLYLKEPSPILTIVIKRFTNGLQKNNSQVDFPLQLSLSSVSLTPGDWLYKLYAVVVHQGGVSGGHYIAYTRRGNDSWYYFSDSHYKQVSWQSVKSAQAYILFYEKTK